MRYTKSNLPPVKKFNSQNVTNNGTQLHSSDVFRSNSGTQTTKKDVFGYGSGSQLMKTLFLWNTSSFFRNTSSFLRNRTLKKPDFIGSHWGHIRIGLGTVRENNLFRSCNVPVLRCTVYRPEITIHLNFLNPTFTIHSVSYWNYFTVNTN